MSKRTPRSVKRSCDTLFSKIVRARGECRRCGETKYELLHTAHIYSRKFGSVRYDENNVLCLCAKCHRWAHDAPTEFTDFIREGSGSEALFALQLKKNKVVKRKLADWLELEEELKEKLNGY